MFLRQLTFCLVTFFVSVHSFGLIKLSEPFAKYNSTKSHYLVSIPGSNTKFKSFTAVFETKTNQFLFKIDRYKGDYRVYLNDNGSNLIFLDTQIDTNKENCTLKIYDGTATIRTIEVYKLPDLNKINYLWHSQLLNVEQKTNLLRLKTLDSIYDINLSDYTISKKINDEEGDNSLEKMFSYFIDNDSIFSIQNLRLSDNTLLKDRLLADMSFTEVTDKDLAQKIIVFDVIICRNKAYGRMSVVVYKNPENKRFSPYSESWTQREIEEKLQTYGDLEYAIPEGVDYWIYSGQLYVIE